jgi:nucleotide-binding universal stress UspA family protein
MAAEVGAAREQAVEAGRRVLVEVGDALRESRLIDRVSTRVEFGEPATRLAAVADRLKATLIVVGARGRGPAGSLRGSVSQSLAADPSRPILVVPPRWPLPAPGAARRGAASPSIVCGVDGSSAAMRAARVAGTLASVLGLRFVPVHVDDGAGAFAADLAPEASPRSRKHPRLRLLDAAAATAGHPSAEGHLLRGSPASALAEVAGAESAEMIAVGTRGHGGLKALVLGSVSRALLASASRPVLVINDRPAQGQ